MAVDYTKLLDGNSLKAIKNYVDNTFVSYTKPQTLTISQQKQARVNIGANIEIVDLTTL